MPELPEVETIVRALREGGRGGAPLVSRKVQSVRLLWARSLAVPDESSFLERLPGQDIIDISRRGKYIVMQLSQDFMLVHLRMSGDLRVDKLVDNPDQLLEPHDRAAFWLNGDVRLVFNDPRKFGRIWLVSDPQTVVGRLGPEPLEETFVLPLFFSGLQKRRRQLKPLLLDQGFIAGIGNIYASEILFEAGIHPEKPGYLIMASEFKQIIKSTRKILKQALKYNGTTISDFRRVDEKTGEFQNFLKVYGRQGLACRICGEKIQKLRQNQRSTFLCPSCQN